MVLLAVIEIEGLWLGGREAVGRRKRVGGLVWETVKRSGRSWRCGPVRLTREMCVYESVCECVIYAMFVCTRTVGEESEACARRTGRVFWRPPVLI